MIGWEFQRGALIQYVNKTVSSPTLEGFLSVVFVNGRTKEEVNRTICAENFNWRTAKTFCLYFGYEQAEWDSERVNEIKFVSR